MFYILFCMLNLFLEPDILLSLVIIRNNTALLGPEVPDTDERIKYKSRYFHHILSVDICAEKESSCKNVIWVKN